MVQVVNSVKGVKVLVDGWEYKYNNGWENYCNLVGTHKLTGKEVDKLIKEEEWDNNETLYKELGLDIMSGFCEYYVTYDVERDLVNKTYTVVRSLYNNDCWEEEERFEMVMEEEVMTLPMDGTIYING